MAKESKEFLFTELDNALSKIDPRGSLSTINAFSKVDEFISTGNYLFNAQISGSLFGGIPNSRTVAFAGETGTGKTFLTLNACREAQKKGYYIIYCDSEAAVDEVQFIKFGLDPAKVRYQPINTPLEFKYFVANLLKQLKDARAAGKAVPRIMLVLDSLGNLATTKERSDALAKSEKKDMTKQQELRSLFRVITMDLAEAKIPFIMTAHTYAGIGGFIPEDVMSGGGGPLYNASVITFLYKSQLKEDKPAGEGEVDLKATGIIVRSKPKKNRFARPIQIRFHISFYKGMNPYVGLEQFINWQTCGIERGHIYDEKSYAKWTPEEKKTAEDNGYAFEFEGKKMYFWPKATARNMVVRHLGATIEPSRLFTPTVLTDDILHELDEKIIKPTFQLPNVGDIYDVEEYADALLGVADEDVDDDTEIKL
jgi:RecA/RadA recombinase